MKDLINDCIKSRKKRKMSNSQYTLNHSDKKLLNLHPRFKNFKLEKELLSLKYFDSCKLTKILNDINKEEQINFLREYKDFLNSKIYKYDELKSKIIKDNLNQPHISNLLKYVKEKENYKKIKFIKNPKYYRVTHNINPLKIKSILENQHCSTTTIKSLARDYKISYSAMYNIITNVLDIHFKGIVNLNSRRNTLKNKEIQRLYFIRKYLNEEENAKILYLDESSFNNYKRKTRKWACKANSCIFTDNGRIKSVNLMICMSDERIEHYFINKTTNNCDSFIMFMKKLIVKLEKINQLSISGENKKFIVVLDNCKIHKAKSLINWIKNKNVNLLYLPPYRPEINSSEYLFRRLKKEFYRRIFNNA